MHKQQVLSVRYSILPFGLTRSRPRALIAALALQGSTAQDVMRAIISKKNNGKKTYNAKIVIVVAAKN